MNLRRFVRRLANAVNPAGRERDVEREIRSHLALIEEDFIRRGLSADQARAAAMRALGSTALTMDLHRDARSFVWLDDLQRDVRFAIRTLRRTPGFAAVAILTLAVSLGAPTAFFTLIDTVMLKPLPVRHARELVVFGDARGAGTAIGRQNGSFTLFSYDLYRRLREEGAFDRLSAVQSSKSRVTVRRAGSGVPESAYLRLVSSNYFDVLGTRAALGRLLDSGDDVASPPAAVVSFRYWSERLNRDPSAIGTVTEIDRVPVTIVGVAAPEFYGDRIEADPPSFWVPLATERQLDPSRRIIDAPELHWLYLIGRLAPNVTQQQAQQRVTAALQAWLREHAGSDLSSEISAKIAATRIDLTPGENGITHARREYARALQLLLGISSLVLLIACANLANLLLARGAAREHETAIRGAIGASRGRLIRQTLAESLTLAFAGGGLGLLLAVWGVDLLLALVFHGTDYGSFEATPNARVLAFSFALSTVSAAGFGVLPAVRGTAAAPIRRGRRPGWGGWLVAVQVGVSLVVLAAAGALAQSVANLAKQGFGFDTDRVLVVDVNAARAGYTVARLEPLYRALRARLRAIPGVTNAAFSYYSPFDECCWAFTIAAAGYPPAQDESRSALLNRVSPGYFETLGTRLVRGRVIDERDLPRAARIAVVNEAFVDRFLPGADAVGQRFSIGDNSAEKIEIAGVVENAKYDTPRDRAEPMAFLPLLQQSADEDADAARTHFIRTIEIRAQTDPASLAGAVRQVLAEIDPNLPVFGIRTLSAQVRDAVNPDQLVAVLAGFFGLVALTLTAIGLYGVTAYDVEQRTREIGIRVALGAKRAAVVRMIVGQVSQRGALGALFGIPAALLALRAIATALYGVSPADFRYSAFAALVLVASMIAAAYLPARRASRIEPVDALRHE